MYASLPYLRFKSCVFLAILFKFFILFIVFYIFIYSLFFILFFSFYFFSLFFIVVQVQLSPFSPHYPPPPHHSHLQLPPSIILPFGFVHVSLIHVPWWQWQFYFLLSNLDAFNFSLCLIAVTRTTNTMLNRGGGSGYPCLVPHLTGKAFSFCPLSMMLAVGLSYMAFIVLRYATSIPTLWSVFIKNGCGTLSNAFSTFNDYDQVIFVLPFVYVIYDVYWFVNVVPSLHPCDESHLIIVYDLFIVLLHAVCQYLVEDIGIYVHQQYWPVFSFFVMSLSGFGVRLMQASWKDFGSLLSSWIFWNSLWWIGLALP